MSACLAVDSGDDDGGAHAFVRIGVAPVLNLWYKYANVCCLLPAETNRAKCANNANVDDDAQSLSRRSAALAFFM